MAKNKSKTPQQPEADAVALAADPAGLPKHCAMALDRSAMERFSGRGTTQAAADVVSFTADGLAVITLAGFMSKRRVRSFFGSYGGNTAAVTEAVNAAAGNADVTGVLLVIDSPGGSVEGVTELAAAVRALREVKPVTALVDGMACSAAYWVAAQADEIAATPSSEAGSIGVFMVHDDFSGMLEQRGVVVTYIHSGQFKVEGNSDQPLTDEAKAHFQSVTDHYYDQFTADVAAGRKVAQAVVQSEQFGAGRTYPAAMAVERGLIDRISSTRDAVAALRSRAPSARRARRAAVLPRRSVANFASRC